MVYLVDNCNHPMKFEGSVYNGDAVIEWEPF